MNVQKYVIVMCDVRCDTLIHNNVINVILIHAEWFYIMCFIIKGPTNLLKNVHDIHQIVKYKLTHV